MRKLILILAFLILAAPASAHPGKTDSSGGHYNRSTGEYHYHHGYSAHQHTNGECPYDFDDKTGSSSGSSSYKSSASSNVTRTVTPAPTRYTATAKVTSTPQPSCDHDPNAGSVVYFRQLLPFISAGFTLGTVIASIIWFKFYSTRKQKAAAELARIESENARAVELALARQTQDRQSLEAEYAEQMVRFENSHLYETNKVIDRLRREAEMNKNQYTKYKSWAEQAAANRHSKAIRLIEELHSLNYEPETISRVEAIINTKHDPDLSEGAVYVKRNLSVAVYHYRSFCSDDLVLASKATMKSLGFKPCPCCFNMEQPVLDPTVAISDSASEVYHEVGAPCIRHGGKIMFLSLAIKKGRRPCKMCKPTGKLPDVWY